MNKSSVCTHPLEKKERLHGPDILRGFAALGVVAFHIYYISGMPKTPEFGALFGRFDYLVRLFFAISAFSILYAYHDRLNSKDQIRAFYKARLFRIAPLFYFILGLVLIKNLFSGALPPKYDIVLSATFLFPFVPGKHGSLVGGGWSLGIEWMFYIFLPLLISAITSTRAAIITWAITCFIATFRYENFPPGTTSAPLHEYSILFFLSHLQYFIVGMICFYALKI